MMKQQLSQPKAVPTSSYSRVETHETTPGGEELRRIDTELQQTVVSRGPEWTKPAVPQLKTPQQNNPKPAKSPGLVARPMGFVLDHLPSVVSGRVQPLYQSYAAPTVEKVDNVLDSIVTGARSRIFKVKARDDIAGMEKPGLVARLVGAAERGVDRVLPPARRPQADPGTPSEADSEDAELSSFRRLVTLMDTIRTRVYIHTEVKYIVMKVKTRVWVDVNITRRYRALAASGKALQGRAQAKALASKDACFGYEKRAEAYVAGKYNSAKTTAGEYTTALATRTSNLKNAGVARAQPYVDAVKLRLKPLSDRLTAFVQKLRETERKCVAYLVAKKTMIKDYTVAKKNQITTRTKAKIAPVEEYVAEKYDTTRATAAKYTTRAMTSARAVVEKVLGRDRSAKLGGLLGKYTATISRAVHAHSA